MDWRDKRLQRALDAAPHAQQRPSEALRHTIKKVAISAINMRDSGPISSKSWWNKVWRASGSRHGPWNAAFATLLLGGVITLLWQGQEPAAPVQGDDLRQAVVPAQAPAAPSAAPAPAAAPAPEPGSKVTVAESFAAAAAAATAQPISSQSQPAERAAAAPAPPDLNNLAKVLPRPTPVPEAHSGVKPDAELVPPIVSAVPTPAPAQADAPMAAAFAPRTAATDATAASPAKQATGTLLTPRQAAPSERARATSTPPLPEEWALQTLVYQGRILQPDTAAAQALVQRVLVLVQTVGTEQMAQDQPASNDTPVTLLLTLVHAQGATTARFEARGNRFRWQELGSQPRGGVLSAQQVEELVRIAVP